MRISDLALGNAKGSNWMCIRFGIMMTIIIPTQKNPRVKPSQKEYPFESDIMPHENANRMDRPTISIANIIRDLAMFLSG